jgi:hypothetical protein
MSGPYLRSTPIANVTQSAKWVTPCTLVGMGLDARLLTDRDAMIRINDPAGGGPIDAAGDFDRLIPPTDSSLPLLSRIDPDGDTIFGPSDMTALLVEIDQVVPRAAPGPELRGLLRLRALAEKCRESPALHLRIRGD